ncbi:hypothetical protein [Microbacterium sp. YY-01]|uniref:hypothetical protein n=1 Tax=Microbacterium sp. YY-01 TaxID=3421634 RepID=UPI003D16AC4F
MMDALFTMFDFAEPKPRYADDCFYCHQDANGEWTSLEHHSENHVPLTCDVCGDTDPNRLLFEMSHGITLGGSWDRGKLVCVRLDLNLNHWRYAMFHGIKEPVSPAGDLCLRLGWRFGPDGYAIAPEGWPSGDVDSNDPIVRTTP